MKKIFRGKRITIDQVAKIVSKGFSSIEERMVTKEDLKKEVRHEVESSAHKYFGVMKEWLEGRFDTIGERFNYLENKMDREFKEVKENINQNTYAINNLSMDMIDIQERVAKIEKTR